MTFNSGRTHIGIIAKNHDPMKRRHWSILGAMLTRAALSTRGCAKAISISNPPGRWFFRWQRQTENGLKFALQNNGAGRRQQKKAHKKKPTPVVGNSPYGKSQPRRKRHMKRITGILAIGLMLLAGVAPAMEYALDKAPRQILHARLLASA